MQLLESKLKAITSKDISIREQVDEMLMLDGEIRDLGKDFTKQQKSSAKKQSIYIYRRIKKLDPKTGELLLKSIDK